MKRDHIQTNDRQLACALIHSEEGQDYLKGMYAAANYAWVNRSSMTFLARQVRQNKIFCFLSGKLKKYFLRHLLDVLILHLMILICI